MNTLTASAATSVKTRSTPFSSNRLAALAGLVLACVAPSLADAQVYVSRPFQGDVLGYNLDGSLINGNPLISSVSAARGLAVSGSSLYLAYDSYIGQYSLTGTPIAPTLVSGLTQPYGLVAQSGTLFVASNQTSILSYNLAGASTGTVLTGLSNLSYFALSGSRIFAVDDAGKVGSYTTAGVTVNANLITGINFPGGVAVDGNRLFVVHSSDGKVVEYDAITGGVVNGNFITGLGAPAGLAIGDGRMFVTEINGGPGGNWRVGEYDMSGVAINSNLIAGVGTGLQAGTFITAIPEPSTYAAYAGAAMLGLAIWRRKQRKLA